MSVTEGKALMAKVRRKGFSLWQSLLHPLLNSCDCKEGGMDQSSLHLKCLPCSPVALHPSLFPPVSVFFSTMFWSRIAHPSP